MTTTQNNHTDNATQVITNVLTVLADPSGTPESDAYHLDGLAASTRKRAHLAPTTYSSAQPDAVDAALDAARVAELIADAAKARATRTMRTAGLIRELEYDVDAVTVLEELADYLPASPQQTADRYDRLAAVLTEHDFNATTAAAVAGAYRKRATSTCDQEELADAVVDLGRLALAFGRVDRTGVYHPDGVTPESETDHTVMLGWLACALAARSFPGLDLGLVAQFALIHDAPEVYAGDTPTLRIDAAGRAAKTAREHAAAERLTTEFADRLPWFPSAIAAYERQDTPEARFVRGLDKVLPKIVHLLDGCAGLREMGMRRAELIEVFEQQRADMTGYVGDCPDLMQLRAELVRRLIDRAEIVDRCA